MVNFFDNTKIFFSEELAGELQDASRIDICVGYFNFGGWQLIENLISSLRTDYPKCRLLIGMPPKENDMYKKFTGGLSDPIKLVQFINQLQTKEIQLKITKKNEIHAKLYIIYKNDDLQKVAFLGSSNLTYSGLKGRNGELNAKFNDIRECQELGKWFNSYWESEFTEDYSQRFIEIVSNENSGVSKKVRDIYEEIAEFLIGWEITYLETEISIFQLDISSYYDNGFSKFVLDIKNLVQTYGLENIYLPNDSNPNCETLRDIINKNECSPSPFEKEWFEEQIEERNKVYKEYYDDIENR